MACIYSHLYMGKTAAANCSGALARLLAENESAYHAGLIGPDPFFFDCVPPPVFSKNQRRTGNRIHEVPGDELLAVLLPLARGNDALSAYAIGFLGHFLLDSSVHPYVLAHYKGKDHTRFEAKVEQPLLKRFGSDLYLKNAGHFFRPLERDKHLLRSVNDLVWQLTYSLKRLGEPKAFLRSYKKHRFVQDLFFDPSGSKRRFFVRVERIFHLSPALISGFLYSPLDHQEREDLLLNDIHAEWASPFQPSRIRSESYPELVQKSIDEASIQYALAFSFLSGAENGESSLIQLMNMNAGRTMSHGYAD